MKTFICMIAFVAAAFIAGSSAGYNACMNEIKYRGLTEVSHRWEAERRFSWEGRE